MGGDGEDVVGEVEHCEGGALAENVHEEDAGEGNGDAGAGAGGDISGGSDGLLLPFGGDVRPGYPEIVCVEPSLEMFDLASVLASTGPVNKLNFHRETCSRTLMV